MLFSQRKGLSPAQKLAQVDRVDAELRNGLWTALRIGYFDSLTSAATHSCNLATLFNRYWHSYFKLPIDTLPYASQSTLNHVRKYFFDCEWHGVYDFIEFTVVNDDGDPDRKKAFKTFCNSVLERENSAYRFVDDHITEITSASEIESVEEALKAVSGISGVKAHLSTALELLSDRKNPDYRNSIKESISAVEGISQVMTGDAKATLGEALAILETRGSLHGALKKSISALYGYTSDADGIRHAMLDEATLTFTDAKYMLIACTAFINYILGKAADLDISLDGTSRERVNKVLTQDGSS